MATRREEDESKSLGTHEGGLCPPLVQHIDGVLVRDRRDDIRAHLTAVYGMCAMAEAGAAFDRTKLCISSAKLHEAILEHCGKVPMGCSPWWMMVEALEHRWEDVLEGIDFDEAETVLQRVAYGNPVEESTNARP